MAEKLSQDGVYAEAEMANKAKELVEAVKNREGRDKSVPIKLSTENPAYKKMAESQLAAQAAERTKQTQEELQSIREKLEGTSKASTPAQVYQSGGSKNEAEVLG